MRSVTLACAALLMLVGCAADDNGPSSDPEATTSPVAGCTSFAPSSLATVATADLDGDGTADEVHRVEDGACHLLTGRDGTTPLDTTMLDLPEDADVGVVTLPGAKRQLLLVAGHLIGEGDGVIGPITFNGKPLLPPLPSDDGGLPATARCNASGGIDVVTTEPTQDAAGLAPRYDVTTTSYSLEGNLAKAVANRTDPGVPAEQLRTEQPDLFDAGAVLGTCVTG